MFKTQKCGDPLPYQKSILQCKLKADFYLYQEMCYYFHLFGDNVGII